MTQTNNLADLVANSTAHVVSHHDEQGIMRICINRPDLHNAFNDEVIESLISAFESAQSNPDVRVVILQSVGKSFSAGADLNWMKNMAQLNFAENLQDAERLAHLMRTIYELSKPVIARVQGASFGGALGLVACCDIAIATSKARFCLSEVKIGLVPAVISPYVSKAIGPRAAQRYFLTGEQFDANKALALGLLHDVVDDNELDNTINEIAHALLANSPLAVSAAKSLAHYVADQPIDTQTIAYTTELIATIRVSPEGQEGLSAFLEKRPANWNKS